MTKTDLELDWDSLYEKYKKEIMEGIDNSQQRELERILIYGDPLFDEHQKRLSWINSENQETDILHIKIDKVKNG